MHDRTPVTKGGIVWGVSGSAREIRLRRRFPTVADLRRHARRRVPRFAFEYVDGGVGLDTCVERNAAAFDAVELVPRYGVADDTPSTAVTLFGRSYAAPIGVAPMGLPNLMWPGAEIQLARAAQRARIPYTVGTVGGVTLEQLAEIAPDVLWFQLYRLPADDHAIGFDLVRRAQNAGAHVLVLTLDVPERSKRPRELRHGLVVPFRPTAHTIYDVMTSPAWLLALLRHGQPTFANLAKYSGQNPTKRDVAGFTQRALRGAFSWDEVARYRERWQGPLVVKGIMHPQDAEKALSLGVDGIQVSNHGGRQLEEAPASIDVLPAIAAATGGKVTILLDSGIRSGLDVVRALAVGAHATFAGRAFLYGVGAIGDAGADYVTDLLVEEIRVATRQLGLAAAADARTLTVRHRNAMSFC